MASAGGHAPTGMHLLEERAAAEVPFLIDRRQKRLGGFFGLSVVSHAATVLLVLFIASVLPPATSSPVSTPRRENYDIVWLPQEGPGGGGGGGGNEMKAPPQKAQLKGQDRMSLPVSKPRSPELKKEPPEQPPLEQLDIPAMTMASGLEVVPGTLEGVPQVTGSQGSGTGGGAGTGRGTGVGSGEGSGLGAGSGGGTGGGVYRPGSGVTTPRVIREVKPQYTSEAMRAKIQGEVWVNAVVLPDGTVGDVEIVRSLDAAFGLDQEAIKAVKQWRFMPGTRLGSPVPVLVMVEISFNLR